MNKTKIIATIGPATADKEILKSLIINGMDVIRLNMSHATPSFCREVIDKINELNKELKTFVATMIDIQGPSIRINKIMGGHAFFKQNDKIRVFNYNILGDCTKIGVDFEGIIDNVCVNTVVKIDDGIVELRVIDKGSDYLLCQVIKEGIVEDNKGINFINANLRKNYLSEEDKRIIKFAHDLKVDFLALSFISSYENILDVNDILIDLGDDHIDLIAKIENEDAINDIDNIIKVADGVMVARGDLGAQISIEKVPGIQKKIINKCHIAGKVSIVATELLATMTSNNYPTRAEVSDIANAVLDGTDAVMLCGETTIGKYPIETIKMMEKIIYSAEKDINYNNLMEQAAKTEARDMTGTIAYSAAGCATRLGCKAIFTPTISGKTAKKMSRFRPNCPIVATSPNIETVKSLALNFGVFPMLVDELKTMDEIIEHSKKIAKEVLDLKETDTIVITGGYPFKSVKHTNFIKIEEL